MTLSDDEWIKSHSPIEAEKLHALGLITFMWNACEYKLFELFHLTFGITPQLAWLLVHDLGSVSISDRIKAFWKTPSQSQEPFKMKLNSSKTRSRPLIGAAKIETNLPISHWNMTSKRGQFT